MINLMPYDLKTQTKAARFNFILLGYTFISLFAIVLLGLACGTSYFYTYKDQPTLNSVSNINSNSIQLESSKFQNNLNTDKLIFDRQYSNYKILLELAKSLPQGVIVKSFSITPSSFITQTEIKFYAVSGSIEPQLKSSILRSSVITSYQLRDISVNSQTDSKYKSIITANIMLTRARN